jgi:hydrogenase nickel incorporation protein HypB
MHEEASEEIEIGRRVLEANEESARRNRDFFAKRRIFVVNLMGSPGAGKTTLLEKTIPALAGIRVGVIEGDIEGEADRKRVELAGAAVTFQINTHGACHLLAHQIGHALERINLDTIDLLFIENIGNLVCPAEFDLGESARVMILGVTEGADKPLKYPLMFRKSHALILNKIDLLAQSGCDVKALKKNVRRVNPALAIIELSCRSGNGIEEWLKYLRENVKMTRSAKR